MKRICSLLLAPALLVAGGCALTPADSHQSVQYYDFGPPPQESVRCFVDAQLGGVSASPALQGSRMWYRHAEQPYLPVPYAVSRWSAPPGDLLRRQLIPAFVGSSDNGKITLELLRLELTVLTTGAAEITLELVARHYPAGGLQTQSRHFHLQRQSQASPAGTAKAAGLSVAELQRSLCQWLPLTQ